MFHNLDESLRPSAFAGNAFHTGHLRESFDRTRQLCILYTHRYSNSKIYQAPPYLFRMYCTDEWGGHTLHFCGGGIRSIPVYYIYTARVRSEKWNI